MIPPPGMTEAGAHSSLNNVIPAPRACASAALGIRRGPVQASMGHEITFCGALPTLVPRAGRKRQRKVFIFNDWPGRIPAVLPARFTRRRGDDAAERITQAHPPRTRKTKNRRARTAHSSSSFPRRGTRRWRSHRRREPSQASALRTRIDFEITANIIVRILAWVPAEFPRPCLRTPSARE
jgi:hypothetical protein